MPKFLAQVARENGLHPTLVARWKREYREKPEEAFRGSGHPYKDQAEIAELERLVGKLYAENDSLKKNLGTTGITGSRGESPFEKKERFKMILKNQVSPNPIPVRVATEQLGVSPSGYYKWLARKGKNNRKIRDRPVLEEIHKIVQQFPGYGYRRVTRQLHRGGHVVNHKRVLRLMRENKLLFRKKQFKIITTDSRHKNPVYPNLILGMKIIRPDQVWASDFTYIQLVKEYVYLAVVIDLFGRRCLGWQLSRNLDTDTALDALQKALYTSRNDNLSNLIHHSDRGSQFTSLHFTECLRNHGIQISMSRKGNPYDNAYVESFFKTLKYEEVYLNDYETFKDAWDNIENFIDAVYNRIRMHSALGYKSPIEFEKEKNLNAEA